MVFTAKEIGRFELCSLTNLWAFRLFTFRCIILQLFVSDYLVQMHANYSIDAAEVCAKGKQTNEGSPNILVSLSLREINHNQQSSGSKHICYDIQCFREFRLQPIQFLKKKKKYFHAIQHQSCGQLNLAYCVILLCMYISLS